MGVEFREMSNLWIPQRPWSVHYNQVFKEWHPLCCPVVRDATERVLAHPPVSLGIAHPGEFDLEAYLVTHLIAYGIEQLPEENYQYFCETVNQRLGRIK